MARGGAGAVPGGARGVPRIIEASNLQDICSSGDLKEQAVAALEYFQRVLGLDDDRKAREGPFSQSDCNGGTSTGPLSATVPALRNRRDALLRLFVFAERIVDYRGSKASCAPGSAGKQAVDVFSQLVTGLLQLLSAVTERLCSCEGATPGVGTMVALTCKGLVRVDRCNGGRRPKVTSTVWNDVTRLTVRHWRAMMKGVHVSAGKAAIFMVYEALGGVLDYLEHYAREIERLPGVVCGGGGGGGAAAASTVSGADGGNSGGGVGVNDGSVAHMSQKLEQGLKLLFQQLSFFLLRLALLYSHIAWDPHQLSSTNTQTVTTTHNRTVALLLHLRGLLHASHPIWRGPSSSQHTENGFIAVLSQIRAQAEAQLASKVEQTWVKVLGAHPLQGEGEREEQTHVRPTVSNTELGGASSGVGGGRGVTPGHMSSSSGCNGDAHVSTQAHVDIASCRGRSSAALLDAMADMALALSCPSPPTAESAAGGSTADAGRAISRAIGAVQLLARTLAGPPTRPTASASTSQTPCTSSSPKPRSPASALGSPSSSSSSNSPDDPASRPRSPRASQAEWPAEVERVMPKALQAIMHAVATCYPALLSAPPRFDSQATAAGAALPSARVLTQEHRQRIQPQQQHHGAIDGQSLTFAAIADGAAAFVARLFVRDMTAAQALLLSYVFHAHPVVRHVWSMVWITLLTRHCAQETQPHLMQLLLCAAKLPLEQIGWCRRRQLCLLIPTLLPYLQSHTKASILRDLVAQVLSSASPEQLIEDPSALLDFSLTVRLSVAAGADGEGVGSGGDDGGYGGASGVAHGENALRPLRDLLEKGGRGREEQMVVIAQSLLMCEGGSNGGGDVFCGGGGGGGGGGAPSAARDHHRGSGGAGGGLSDDGEKWICVAAEASMTVLKRLEKSHRPRLLGIHAIAAAIAVVSRVGGAQSRSLAAVESLTKALQGTPAWMEDVSPLLVLATAHMADLTVQAVAAAKGPPQPATASQGALLSAITVLWREMLYASKHWAVRAVIAATAQRLLGRFGHPQGGDVACGRGGAAPAAPAAGATGAAAAATDATADVGGGSGCGSGGGEVNHAEGLLDILRAAANAEHAPAWSPLSGRSQVPVWWSDAHALLKLKQDVLVGGLGLPRQQSDTRMHMGLVTDEDGRCMLELGRRALLVPLKRRRLSDGSSSGIHTDEHGAVVVVDDDDETDAGEDHLQYGVLLLPHGLASDESAYQSVVRGFAGIDSCECVPCAVGRVGLQDRDGSGVIGMEVEVDTR